MNIRRRLGSHSAVGLFAFAVMAPAALLRCASTANGPSSGSNGGASGSAGGSGGGNVPSSGTSLGPGNGSSNPLLGAGLGSGDTATDAGVAAAPLFTGPLAGPFHDFPAAPVLDSPDGGGVAAPSNAADLFGPATQGASSGGPCLVEPETGSLYPNNWLRPRFAWFGSSDANLYELRVHAANQASDLVVYTAQTQWTMPKSMWDALRADSQAVPMTVSVRSGRLAGTQLTNEALGSAGDIGIAPVGAPGSIVYWAIVDYMGQSGQGGTGVLSGFRVGDESVVTVLAGNQVLENAPPTGNRACIGCHASTPDGLAVGFQAEWLGPGGYKNTIATLGQDASPGNIPPYLTPEAGAFLGTVAGAPTYSAAHWTAGDRIELLGNSGDLTWVDLEGQGANVSGILPRSLSGTAGDSELATAPTWSHDGNTVVYTSVARSRGGSLADGRPANGPMDLYSVPYNAKSGGNAAPLPGASDPMANEYYPAFSPNDQYIAFVRLAGNGQTYNSPGDEVNVVPAGGGTATRLDANDPPACTGAMSPGVANAWPRWSPGVQTIPALGNATYYWIVFSSTRPNWSNRYYGPQQLYITPVVVDPSGKITTYHSLYLWNQSPTAENHLPAWDVFQIPPVPPSVPPPR